MVVETRLSPSRSTPGTVDSPAANLASEMITSDQIFQWTLEGKCFTASIPVESDPPDGGTDHSDTAQTYMLNSDTAGTKLIIPLATTICPEVVSSGSETVLWVVAHIRSTNATGTLRTVSGTSMTIINNRGDLYGTQTATALYTVTSSALVAADWNEIAVFKTNQKSNQSANTGIAQNTVVLNHFNEMAPLVLYKGGSLSAQCFASTAPRMRLTFQWAELDASVYL